MSIFINRKCPLFPIKLKFPGTFEKYQSVVELIDSCSLKDFSISINTVGAWYGSIPVKKIIKIPENKEIVFKSLQFEFKKLSIFAFCLIKNPNIRLGPLVLTGLPEEKIDLTYTLKLS